MQSPQGTLNKDDWKQILATLASTLLTTLVYVFVMYLSNMKWDMSTPFGIYMFNVMPFLIILVKQLVTGLPLEDTSISIKTFNPPVDALMPPQTPSIIVPETNKPDTPNATPS